MIQNDVEPVKNIFKMSRIEVNPEKLKKTKSGKDKSPTKGKDDDNVIGDEKTAGEPDDVDDSSD